MTTEFLDRAGDFDQAGRRSARIAWDITRQQACVAQCIDGLMGEARIAVDVGRVSSGDLRTNLCSGVSDVAAGQRADRRHEAATPLNSSSALRIAAMLANVGLRSRRSGNSMSKASSRPSITLTLACDVKPAAYRSSRSSSVETSTVSRPNDARTSRI